MPSLLCLLTDIVKTHPPGACLGQSRVPKARISCLFTPVTAMFKVLAVSSPSCSGPDTNTLSSKCLGPNMCPPGQPPCQLQTSTHSSLRPVSVLFRTRSIYLPWKKWEQRSIGGEQPLRHPWSLAKDSLPPVPWPQALLLRHACFPLGLEPGIFC